MIKKIYPKCIERQKAPTLTARGYFLPCCWCDMYKTLHQFESLMKDHLNINNVTDIQDIFHSEEWDEFFRILKEDPDSAPPVCKVLCSTPKKLTKDSDEK